MERVQRVAAGVGQVLLSVAAVGAKLAQNAATKAETLAAKTEGAAAKDLSQNVSKVEPPSSGAVEKPTVKGDAPTAPERPGNSQPGSNVQPGKPANVEPATVERPNVELPKKEAPNVEAPTTTDATLPDAPPKPKPPTADVAEAPEPPPAAESKAPPTPAPDSPSVVKPAKPKVDYEAKFGENKPETPNLTDPDRAVLNKDLADREAARTTRDTAEAAQKGAVEAGDTAEAARQGDIASKAKGQVNKASESLGEHGADAAIKSKFPGAEQTFPPPGMKAGGKYTLDLVYKDGDRLIVVEAKGGASELATRTVEGGKIAQQGSKEYLNATLDSMERRGGKYAEAAAEVREALKNGKVDYYKAKTPIGTKKGSAVVKPTTLQKFAI
jgi:hypothetical protein